MPRVSVQWTYAVFSLNKPDYSSMLNSIICRPSEFWKKSTIILIRMIWYCYHVESFEIKPSSVMFRFGWNNEICETWSYARYRGKKFKFERQNQNLCKIANLRIMTVLEGDFQWVLYGRNILKFDYQHLFININICIL